MACKGEVWGIKREGKRKNPRQSGERAQRLAGMYRKWMWKWVLYCVFIFKKWKTQKWKLNTPFFNQTTPYYLILQVFPRYFVLIWTSRLVILLCGYISTYSKWYKLVFEKLTLHCIKVLCGLKSSPIQRFHHLCEGL